MKPSPDQSLEPTATRATRITDSSFDKRSLLLIRTHNETLSVIAVCVKMR